MRRKIFISNLIMVFVPLALALLFWALYSTFSGTGSTRLSEDNTGSLSDAQRIFYQYESELKDIDWNNIDLQQEADYILSDDSAKISELEGAGYHLQVSSGESILFSNFDSTDESIVSVYLFENADGYFVKSNHYTVIRDSFEGINGRVNVTAVHDSERADSGIGESLVPIYFIPTSVFIVFMAQSLILWDD